MGYRFRFLALFLALAVIACGDDEGMTVFPDADASGGDAGDSSIDDSGADAGEDADTSIPMVDATVDAARDATPDAAPDAVVDAGECSAASDCDDGVFCNGAEDCVGGACTAGTDPADDGVDCTVDVCDEGTDAVTNRPNDGVCTSLDRVYCDASGQVAEDTGSCNPASGCEADTVILNACDTPPMCTAGRPAHTSEACVEAGGSASCVGTATLCRSPADRCSSGTLTVRRATCDPATGCGTANTSNPCSTAASTCAGGAASPFVHTSYAPLCADATSCDPRGTPTMTTCTTPARACIGDVHTIYRATCDAATGCGTATSTTDCAAMNTATCIRRVILDSTVCSCDAATGCACTTTRRTCATPTCVAPRATETCTSCAGTACAGCTRTLCTLGCDPATGLCR